MKLWRLKPIIINSDERDTRHQLNFKKILLKIKLQMRSIAVAAAAACCLSVFG